MLELEYGFDGTLLREPESVHGGSEHRGEEGGIGAMVLNRSSSSEVLRGEMLVPFEEKTRVHHVQSISPSVKTPLRLGSQASNIRRRP